MAHSMKYKGGRGWKKNAMRHRLDSLTVADFEHKKGHECEYPVKTRKCKKMYSPLKSLEKSVIPKILLLLHSVAHFRVLTSRTIK